jgi:predicted dienelactone hydrolase
MCMTLFLRILSMACALLLCGCSLQEDATVVHSSPKKMGLQRWDFEDPVLNRSLTGFLWYPIANATPAVPVDESAFQQAQVAMNAPVVQNDYLYPLIVLIPGDGLGVDSLAWLAEVLVGNGYIVASVEPKGWQPTSLIQLNPWQQPEDVSALLTHLESLPYSDLVDPKRIAAISFGSGSLAAVWLAGGSAPTLEPQQLIPPKEAASKGLFGWISGTVSSIDIAPWRRSYHDPRIKSFMMLAPEYAWIYQEKDFKNIIAGFFVIAGESDKEVDIGENAVRFAQWIPQAQFIALQGHVGHWDFLAPWTSAGPSKYKSILPKAAFPSIPLEHRREGVHEQVSELAIKYFNQELK